MKVFQKIITVAAVAAALCAAVSLNAAAADGDKGRLKLEGRDWVYVDSDGNRDPSYNGLAENIEGIWYVSNGKLDSSANGLVKITSGDIEKGEWVYLDDGLYQKKTLGRTEGTYTGMAKNRYDWWYVKDNKIDYSYTGVAENQYGNWYITKGKLDHGYDGLGEIPQKGIWHFINGGVDKVTDGLTKITKGDIENGEWVYLIDGCFKKYENGKLKGLYTGMAKNAYDWWYVTDGKIDYTYTGAAKNPYGIWFIEKGQLGHKTYALAEISDSGIWYFSKGAKNTTYTGMVKIYDGNIRRDKWVYIVKGLYKKLSGKDYVGLYTGMAKNQYGWWYITDSDLDQTFNGLARNPWGMWNIRNGKLDEKYSGSVKKDGMTYTITSGKVTGADKQVVSYAIKALNTTKWDLKSAYTWCVYKLDYDKYCVPTDGSLGAEKYAIYGFKNRKGNCYCFSNCFVQMARLLDYDAHAVRGTVPYRDGTRGNHSWAEITIDGKTYVCDPQYDHQLLQRGRTRISQYMFEYGDKGTLKYNRIAAMN